MTHEKTFILVTGRSVKVIAKASPVKDQSNFETEIEVLIKEPREENYRPAIGQTHPKYWKLRKLDSIKTQLLQIKYSGVSEKQIRKTIREFREKIMS
ncbi:hypothetical protein [Dyadobacter sp. 32]|uniref:hypothetical protein n=1 Tax=Dyadobacter sp. 32 TaxID=538966 RepID=UPI0011EE77FC